MSRVCQLSGKRANNGMAVSHSHVRTKKLQQVNLQQRRLWWAEGNRWVKLRVSTSALRTIQKKGLGAYAKELGINLAKIWARCLAWRSLYSCDAASRGSQTARGSPPIGLAAQPCRSDGRDFAGARSTRS